MKRLNIKLAVSLIVGIAVLGLGVHFLHAIQVERNAEGVLAQAQSLYENGKLQDAYDYGYRYLNLRGEDSQGVKLLADIAYDAAEKPDATLKKLRRAFYEMERAVRVDKDDKKRRRRLLEYHVKFNSYTAALDHIKLLRADAEELDPDLELIAARCFAVTGDFDESSKICQKLIGYDPIEKTFRDDAPGRKEVDAYVLLASLFRERKTASEAEADHVVEQMVAVNEDSSKAHLAAHEYWKRVQNTQRAKEALVKAHQLDPESPDVVLPMAVQSLEDKDLDQAEALIQGALDKHADDPRLYRGMALVQLRRQNRPGAIEVLNQGLEKLPESEVLLNTLLSLHLEQGELEKAKKIFVKLKELGFNESLLDLYQAQFLVQERKWSEAIDKLKVVRSKLVHDSQRVAQIDTLLAHCYQATGDLKTALDLYRGISTQRGGLTTADLGQAQILAKTGKNDEALKHYEAIAKALGDDLLKNPQVWRALLELRVWDQMRQPPEKRDWSKSEELLAQIKESGAIDAVEQVGLEASLLLRQGDTDSARALYARALGQNPASEMLWAGRIDLELQAAGPDAALRLAEHVPGNLQDGLLMRLVRASIFSRMSGELGKAGLVSLEKNLDKFTEDEQYRLLLGLAQEHRRHNDTEQTKRLLGQVMAMRKNDLLSRGLLFDIARDDRDIETMQRMADDIRRIAEPKSPFPALLDAVTTITQVGSTAKVAADKKHFELNSEEKAQLAEARKLLEESVKANTSWSEPHKWLAEIFAMESNMDGMLEELRAAARLGPLEPARNRQLYDLLVAKGLDEEAQEVYKLLPKGNLKGTEWSQVNSLIQSKRLDEARELLDTMAPKEDASAAELVRYADARRRTNDLALAESALKRAVEADGSVPDAWLLLVNTQVTANRMSDAEATIEQAKARLPEEGRDLVLAQCYEGIRDPARAEKSYLKAVAAKPRDLAVNQAAAGFYLRTTKSDQATKYLDTIAKEGAQAKSAADKAVVAWSRRARAVVIAAEGSWQRFQEAEQILLENEEETRKKGDEPSAADLLLRISLLANRSEPSSLRAALALFEELQSRQPLQVNEQVNLARLYERVGNWPKAKEVMTGVVASRDADPLTFLAYAEMLLRNGAYSEVDVWLSRYDRARNDGRSLPIRVTLRVRQKRDKDAVNLIANWLGPLPWSSAKMSQVAQAAKLLQELGLYAEAEKLWRVYVKSDPRATIILAQCVGLNNKLDEAFSLLDASLKHQPPRDVLLIGMQIVRARQALAQDKHFAQLGRWYSAAREAEPGNMQLELALGEVREMRGELDKAEAIYRNLLGKPDLDPAQRAAAANNLAFILSTQRKNTDEAIRLIDSAMKVIGPSSDLVDTRGVVYLAADQPDKALADFQEAVLVPTAMKWVHLAFAQSALNLPNEARASLKKAQEANLKREDLYDAEWVRYERLARDLAQ